MTQNSLLNTDNAAGLGTGAAATLLIGGQWRSASAAFEVVDPATLEVIGSAADADPSIAQEALDAACGAFPAWRAVPAEERGNYLRAAAARLRTEVEPLANLLTAENGKPLAEARAEILGSARMLEWSAEEGRRTDGRIVPPSPRGPGLVMSSPVGPVLAISPWNFPASMMVRKIGLSLAAGAPIVVKPAEQTPLIAAAIVRIINDAGLPDGVLNLVTTAQPGVVVDHLLADERLRKVSFTGSTKVGLSLASRTGARLHRISLEMGGHAPAIVFADADVASTVASIVTAKFANAGQSCTAINRLYLHRDVHDEVLAALQDQIAELRLGHGAHDGTTTGPLIDAAGLAKVEEHVDDAVARGATALAGGSRWNPPDQRLQGAFYEPTILTGVDDTMRISSEETFGPVLPVYVFDDDDAVVDRANNSQYGLAAYVFATEFQRIWRTVDQLDFGVIAVNDATAVRPELPFGGMKNSGHEREGGSEGIQAYLETKAVAVRL